MIGSLLIITGGLVLFALGAERIVRSSDAMARRLGFTPFFYALTVVALATSLPELVVNSAHAVRGNYSLVVDDVYGTRDLTVIPPPLVAPSHTRAKAAAPLADPSPRWLVGGKIP